MRLCERSVVIRSSEFLTAGLCSLLNVSGPSYGAAPSRSVAVHFGSASRHLVGSFRLAVSEAKDESNEVQFELELGEEGRDGRSDPEGR